MRAYFQLLKLQLNVLVGWSVFGWSRKNDRKAFNKALSMGAAIGISMLYLLGLYGFLLYQLYSVPAAYGTAPLVLAGTVLIAMALMLVFGLYFVLGTLFFAKDTQWLMPLPLSQGTIFGAKFTLVYLREALIACAFVLPSGLLYGILNGAGPLFYALLVPVTLLLPALPLGIAALLSLVLMRAIARVRRKELIATIGGILMVVAIVFLQMWLTSRLPADIGQDFIASLISSQSALISFVCRALPPAGWAALSLTQGGGEALINFAYYALSCAAVLLAAVLVSRSIYARAATAHTQSARIARRAPVALAMRSRRPVWRSVMVKEWKVILRSPIYALNSLVAIIMGPLMMLMPLMFQTSGDPQLDALLSMLTSGDGIVVGLLLAALATFIACINPATGTSVSREGAAYPLLCALPIDPRAAVLGKFMMGFSISALAVIATIGGAALVIPFGAQTILFAAFIALVYSLAFNALFLIVDILRPKLNWNSEQEAIKQNMNVVLSMLIEMIVVFALAFAGGALLPRLGAPSVALLFSALGVAFAVVSLAWLFRLADKRLMHLRP